jgi:hypothetical protein
MFITQIPVREWACDRESRIRRLDKALDEAQAKGWTIVECGLMEIETAPPPAFGNNTTGPDVDNIY